MGLQYYGGRVEVKFMGVKNRDGVKNGSEERDGELTTGCIVENEIVCPAACRPNGKVFFIFVPKR